VPSAWSIAAAGHKLKDRMKFFNYPSGTGLVSEAVFGRLAGASAGNAARNQIQPPRRQGRQENRGND
jgi:hypothetical protein